LLCGRGDRGIEVGEDCLATTFCDLDQGGAVACGSAAQHPGVIGRAARKPESLQILGLYEVHSFVTVALYEREGRYHSHYVDQSKGNASKYRLGYDWNRLLRPLPAGGR
jgi:hypothetical protein